MVIVDEGTVDFWGTSFSCVGLTTKLPIGAVGSSAIASLQRRFDRALRTGAPIQRFDPVNASYVTKPKLLEPRGPFAELKRAFDRALQTGTPIVGFDFSKSQSFTLVGKLWLPNRYEPLWTAGGYELFPNWLKTINLPQLDMKDFKSLYQNQWLKPKEEEDIANSEWGKSPMALCSFPIEFVEPPKTALGLPPWQSKMLEELFNAAATEPPKFAGIDFGIGESKTIHSAFGSFTCPLVPRANRREPPSVEPGESLRRAARLFEADLQTFAERWPKRIHHHVIIHLGTNSATIFGNGGETVIKRAFLTRADFRWMVLLSAMSKRAVPPNSPR
jgi:hypothetical protein